MNRRSNENPHPQKWFVAILSDPHFWVPLIVLVGGLMVLRWIS